MSTPLPSVGFAGLGAMGSGVVRRLLVAGYPVTGWNRTPEKAQALAAEGMALAATPRELAASVDVVLSMLTDTAAVRQVAAGPDGILAGLSAGTVWAEMSTISPDASVALAGEVAATGARLLDAPVSGSPVTLEQGQLSIMVGGEREAFERVEPVLRAIGPKVRRLGDNGHALLTKVAINLALVASMTALAEGVALAERAGADRSAVVDAMLESVIASPVAGYRAPLLLDGNRDRVYADADLQQKDLVLALDLARRLGAALPLTAATSEMLNAARGIGRRDKDFVVGVHEAYLRLAGREP